MAVTGGSDARTGPQLALVRMGAAAVTPLALHPLLLCHRGRWHSTISVYLCPIATAQSRSLICALRDAACFNAGQRAVPVAGLTTTSTMAPLLTGFPALKATSKKHNPHATARPLIALQLEFLTSHELRLVSGHQPSVRWRLTSEAPCMDLPYAFMDQTTASKLLTVYNGVSRCYGGRRTAYKCCLSDSALCYSWSSSPRRAEWPLPRLLWCEMKVREIIGAGGPSSDSYIHTLPTQR